MQSTVQHPKASHTEEYRARLAMHNAHARVIWNGLDEHTELLQKLNLLKTPHAPTKHTVRLNVVPGTSFQQGKRISFFIIASAWADGTALLMDIHGVNLAGDIVPRTYARVAKIPTAIAWLQLLADMP